MTIISGAPTLSPPVSERDHVIGPAAAPVTLVEYGDYECPYCGAAHPIVKEVRRRLGKELRFAFRHFPLTRIHPHAERAAEAAEAAAAQGRFWEMHRYLFAHQHSLVDSNLLQYSNGLGLDTARFERDLGTHAQMGRIDADVESGLLSG